MSDTPGMSSGEPVHVRTARAVYDHSAEQFVEAVGTTVSPDFEAPLDRAVLHAFAEDLLNRPGSVLDAGCGPGRVAALLAGKGLRVQGIDLSSGMIEAARKAHPHIDFDVAPLTALPVADDSLAGVAYWYSIIATPLEELGSVWAELDRVLVRTGLALIAFQAGDNESLLRPDAYGSSSTLTLYHHNVEAVVESLGIAEFNVRAEVRRRPRLAHESTDQAFLLVERCPTPAG